MRDANNPNTAVLSAIGRDLGGVAVVLYANREERDWIVNDVASLLPLNDAPLVTCDVERALQGSDRVVFLVPNDERAAVLALDAGQAWARDLGSPHTRPVVLFLQRGGPGQEALASVAFHLARLVQGRVVDPEKLAEVDVDAERQDFITAWGETPESWLVRWQAEKLPATAANVSASYRAKLLERR
jgi:hypothetical protein